MSVQRTSIQQKLMRLNLIVIATVLFIACFLFLAYEFVTHREVSREELMAIGEITASNTALALSKNDLVEINDLLQSLQLHDHIQEAALYNQQGKLVSAYPQIPQLPHFPDEITDQSYGFNTASIEGYQPVILEGKRMGTLYLRSDMNAVYNRLKILGAISVGFFGFAFLLTLLLSRRLQRSFTYPILHLAEKATQVSTQKDYSVRARQMSDDEMGLLTDAFNKMLEQIERQNKQIHALNASLEEKITIRTWELQEANLALTEQNEFIQTIIDSSVDLISVLDRDLRYVMINKQAASQLGKKREKLIGEKLPDVFPNLVGGDFLNLLDDVAANPNDRIQTIRTKLGFVDLENFVIPVTNGEGLMDRILIISHDVTSIIRAQEKLQQMNTELERSNRDLEQFAYIASHDLQEPLRKIITFSDLAEQNIYSPEAVHTYLLKIFTSANRMSDLIKAVLNYSLLSNNTNEFADTDLATLIKQIVIDLELQIEETSATVQYDQLPVVSGIPFQLTQLFTNLFTNALKFTKGKPLITIRTAPILSGDPVVKHLPLQNSEYRKIVFSDNGIGFHQKDATKIFSIFRRLHSNERFAGTGIGLALCKKIVENHFGWIEATSEEGKGSVFTVYLPHTKPALEKTQTLQNAEVKQQTANPPLL